MFQARKDEVDFIVVNGLFVPKGCELERLPLAKEHAHERDAVLYSREHDHRYFLCGRSPEETNARSRNLVSVSAVLGLYEAKFDAVKKSEEMARNLKKNYERDPKYGPLVRGKPREQYAQIFRESWSSGNEEKRVLGKIMHRSIELELNGIEVQDDSAEVNQLRRYIKAKKDLGYVPFRPEWGLWTDSVLQLCGSVDLLMIRETDLVNGVRKLLLVDWKRSQGIYGHDGYNNMNFPLHAFSSCNLHKYSFQLNMYKFFLEHYYGYEIEAMEMVVAHPQQTEAHVILVEELGQDVQNLLHHFLDLREQHQQQKQN